MVKKYSRIALRNLKKRWIFSLINVLGLSISLTAFTFIMLWIRNELSYDNFNINSKRIYRVTTYIKQDNGDVDMAMTAPPLAAALRQLPVVQNVVRLSGPRKNVIVRYEQNEFNENEFFYADSTIFQIFSFPLITGNSRSALKDPYSIVISKEMAYKYFGISDPLGKVLNIKWNKERHDYLITGVMEEIPDNSHFHASFIASLTSVETSVPGFNSEWGGVELYTYVLLNKNNAIDDLNRNLSGIIRQNLGVEASKYWTLRTQKLGDIHLNSHSLMEIEPNGSKSSIYIFLTVGILILMVSLINFVSLSTARYSERMKEVGIRKILGAGRKDLIGQFMYENLILVCIALILSAALIELLNPYFNLLTGKVILLTLNNVLIALLAGLFFTVIAVSYPAIFLSSFSPARILNKSEVFNPGGAAFRKMLIVVQFTISVILIIGSFIINDQLHFIITKDLGINIDQTIFIPLRHSELRDKYQTIKNELIQLRGVKDISASSTNPVNMNMMSSLFYQDRAVLSIKFMAVDYNFIEMMGLKLISGRNFSKQYSTDSTDAIIVNESAANKLKKIGLFDKQLESVFDDDAQGNTNHKGLRIIGVVNDFNYRPLYYPIEPMVLYASSRGLRFIEVKLSPSALAETLNEIEKKWKQLVPGYPFDFTFLNENLQKEYESDKRIKSIFNVFSILSILIASMGLFGLSSYSAEKRIKEIGIRKVLGSSVMQIVILLSKDFIKLITLSFVLSFPIAYYLMQKWLEQFSYRIEISLWTFIISFLIVLLISCATISYQAVKAAIANPVKSLKYE